MKTVDVNLPPIPSIDLQLGEGFEAPAELLTSATGVLGVRGSGKTTSAGRIVEEAVRIGVPASVIDPTGAWFGLKSSADGKSPGLPVYIFGGEHADIPLEPDAGAILGRFIVEKRVPAVLDLSLMRKGQQIRFVADFAETVYHLNREPLLVVVDETARFCPQNARGLMSPDVGRCIGAIDDIVALGRRRGLGAVLIGQRGARINKDVLTQCQTLLAHQITSPQDRKAVNEWVEEQHGSDEQAREFMKSLTTLPIGTAFVWSPTVLQIFKKVKMRNRWTFDSSATPKVGQKAATPTVFAKVDLSDLTAELAELKSRSDADDPKVLRARIAELEARGPHFEAVATSTPILTEEQTTLLRLGAATVDKLIDEVILFRDKFGETIERSRSALVALSPIFEAVNDALDGEKPPIPYEQQREADRRVLPESATKQLGTVLPEALPRVAERRNGTPELSKQARALLGVIAQYPEGVTQKQLALTAGYSTTSGGLFAALALLRRLNYIERGKPILITSTGRKAVGPIEPLPSGKKLREYWFDKLEKQSSTILQELCEIYPRTISQREVAQKAGYSGTSGGLFAAVARLRALKLIDGPGHALRASEVLFAR